MQKICVTARGNRCIIRFQDITVTGFCGRNGVTPNKREGDNATPMGIFPIRYGFYRKNRPETALPMVSLSPFHHFVDDPLSPCYNRLLYGRPHHHSEAMWDYPDAYKLGLAMEYNRRPMIQGKGSAVFVHCGNKPTAGCIALPFSVLSAIVCRLDPAKAPYICITADENG